MPELAKITKHGNANAVMIEIKGKNRPIIISGTQINILKSRAQRLIGLTEYAEAKSNHKIISKIPELPPKNATSGILRLEENGASLEVSGEKTLIKLDFSELKTIIESIDGFRIY